MTLREVGLTNQACVTQQFHAESTAAIRAARMENELAQLIDTTRCLQRTADMSHNLFQCGRVEADRRATQLVELLLSVKSTIETLNDGRRASEDREDAPRAVSSFVIGNEAEELTHRIIKVYYIFAS